METPLDLAALARALATTQLSLGLRAETMPSSTDPRMPAALLPDLREVLATLLLEASGVRLTAQLGGDDAS